MKKFLMVLLSLLLAVLIGTGIYIYKLLDLVQESPVLNPDTGKPIEDPSDIGIDPEAPDPVETGVINIMLFGTDNRNRDEQSRSDSMMIASIDKKNKTVKVTSLMRDMYVPIPGKGDNRLNTAYLYGGPSLAIKTVNYNFKMNITDYISVDFFSMEKIIDEIGGILIDIKQNEISNINEYIEKLDKMHNDGKKTPLLTEPGLQVLSGRQAVSYCRIRSAGNGDFERTERQRRVLNELFKKGKQLGVSRIPGLVAKILPEVETSLSKTEIIDLAIAMIGFSTSDIEQFRLPVNGAYTDERINGMMVLMPDMEKNRQLLHEFIYGKDEGEPSPSVSPGN